MKVDFFYVYSNDDLSSFIVTDDISNDVVINNDQLKAHLELSNNKDNVRYLKDVCAVVKNASEQLKVGDKIKRKQVRLNLIKNSTGILWDAALLCNINKSECRLSSKKLVIDIDAKILR